MITTPSIVLSLVFMAAFIQEAPVPETASANTVSTTPVLIP